MSTVQRVAKNTGIIITGEIICKIIAVVTIIYLARYLHPIGFGKFSFVFAYLAFFAELTDLGLKSILVRDMSRDKSTTQKLIANAHIIKLLLSTFAIVLAMIVITLMSYPADTTTYVYVASFTLLFASFSELYTTVFQANLKMEYNIIARIVFRIFSIVLIFWIIFSQGTLMQVIIALVFSEMVKTLIIYSFSRRFVRPRFSIDFKLWKYLLKESLPIALSSVTWVIYHRVDVVMLSMMQGDAPVGIYSAAYGLFEPLGFISGALMISLFPLMSAYFISSREKLIRTYRLSVKYLLIIALPIAIGITFIADKIIFLVYGAEFAGSATALQILIWAFVFISVNSVLSHLLIAMNRQKIYALCSALCAIVNIILNFILIPVLSYSGASIATVAANAVLFITSFYFVSKYLLVLPMHKILPKPVISGLIMGAFMYCFIYLNVFLLVPLAVGIYLVALIAFKTFSTEDIDVLKNVLSRE